MDRRHALSSVWRRFWREQYLHERERRVHLRSRVDRLEADNARLAAEVYEWRYAAGTSHPLTETVFNALRERGIH